MSRKTDKCLNIVLLEPFLAGSHQSWAQELAHRSRHDITIMGMTGRYWKWRMHGGAVSLAQQFLANAVQPDLILASDMLDLTTFQALTRQRTAALPTVLYFHENQLTYPWSPADADISLQRDSHYAFINYTSALAADLILFNSYYHQDSFLSELPGFLAGFPDYSLAATCTAIRAKSKTLPLGLDLQQLDKFRPESCAGQSRPLILWNHRWEYDKNPDAFFQVLYDLNDSGVEFDLAVLGESYRTAPPIFSEAKERLAAHIVHWGFAESKKEYVSWLWRADYLPVTSFHDFFGASVVEAIYCNCFPLLPKRMAYPEHLPEDLVDNYSYVDNHDLTLRLKALLEKGRVPPADRLRSKVAGSECIPACFSS